MTSPNEPGHPGPGDGAGNGDGPGDAGDARRANPQSGGGRITHTGETPPWQRGTQRPRQAAQRPPEAPEPRPAGNPPDGATRPNRVLSQSTGPGGQATSGKPPTPESYDSELPDLSGSTPRQPAGTAAPERGRDTVAAPMSVNRAPESHARTRGPVRAAMQLRRIDPWSALKVSLILSVALFFVWMIAVALLYLLLGSMGVWTKLNSNVGDLLTEANGGGGGELVSSGAVFGGATLIGLVNIVVLTAMGTVGALVYNITTELIGGVEVTLADRD